MAGRAGLDLRRPRTAAFLLAGGAALALVARVVAAVSAGAGGQVPEASGPAISAPPRAMDVVAGSRFRTIRTRARRSDLAHTTGTALAGVIGLCLLLPRAVLWLFAAVGAIPLTL